MVGIVVERDVGSTNAVRMNLLPEILEEHRALAVALDVTIRHARHDGCAIPINILTRPIRRALDHPAASKPSAALDDVRRLMDEQAEVLRIVASKLRVHFDEPFAPYRMCHRDVG